MATTRTHQAASPPYSVASEKIILATLLRDPQAIVALRSLELHADDFFRPEHGKLFHAINAACIVDSELTSSTLTTQLKNSSDPLNIVDALLASAVIDTTSALHHATLVIEKARQRRLIDTLSNILHDAYQNTDGCDAVIKRAKKRLTELQREVKPTSGK
jgi:replicative DNA helicase